MTDWVDIFRILLACGVGAGIGWPLGRIVGARDKAQRRRDVIEALRAQPDMSAYMVALGSAGWIYSTLRDLEDEGFVERVADEEPSVPGTTVRRVKWRLLA